MSYPPPGPGNNPYANNPYAQQPPQQQSPYGYPQQPPQGGQPAYGYPQAPPPAPMGMGAMPGAMPGVMPSNVNGLRVMLFIAGGLQSLVSIGAMIAMAALTKHMDNVTAAADLKYSAGVLYFVSAFFLAHAITGIVLGTSVAKGGNGVRIGGIVWASFLILFGLPFIPLGMLWVAIGITCIVLFAQSGAWFNRPRY
ncbi:MAG: hypothetical protein ACRDP3_15905 [Streptomyces sp.]|uniref:hypothetical protein n=1 Tax=Streptomyces sp. TaxID=1931 RepID=UPI003D6BCAE3